MMDHDQTFDLVRQDPRLVDIAKALELFLEGKATSGAGYTAYDIVWFLVERGDL